MGIRVDREDLFREKMSLGINLFTGAGFSCLPDDDGNKLPIVDELCPEICGKFNLPYATFGNDLEIICALAKGEELQHFLRKKFTVKQINKKYFLLNKINLLSYITTNIDNIIHLSIEKGHRYYLKSLTYYGAVRKEHAELCYIPLHGEVLNNEKELYFGKFDLATADQANSDLFQQATLKLRDTPLLFWGYGFHDSGVLKTVQKLLSYGPQDIWIQCLSSNEKQIKLFEGLGCNIIVADTEQLFDWIDNNIFEKASKVEGNGVLNNRNLAELFLPTINQVPAVQAKDYYVKGNTQWYSILAKQAVELDIVNDVYNASIKNKDVVLIGTDFSGKTTTLMQLALKINVKNKLFVNELTTEKSKFIINNLAGEDATIFVDDCEHDMDGYRILTRTRNVRTIATATDYTFEASKHLLEGSAVKAVFIKDLTQEQARRFYNSIDRSLRQEIFTYKAVNSDNEKFSILEMMLNNITNSLKKERIKELLLKVLRRDRLAFETVALAVYLSGNNSALSTDILFTYFNCSEYEETTRYVNEANGLLRELDLSVDSCDYDQDYYDVRSKLFLYHAKKLLSEEVEFRSSYSDVIEKLINEVSTYKIYQYYLFRRSAYDAKLFYTLFKQKAIDIYSKMYDYDMNPYTLQQRALCRAYLMQFKEAFADIDKALRQKPCNFSMENTHAIILFEANRDEKNETGRQKRSESMEILERCYYNDKRKTYHANKFAEFAIEIAKIDNNNHYIEKASDWIAEIIERGDGVSYDTKKYAKQLEDIKKQQ